MLPIKIETLPDRETSLQIWKLVEKQLVAIAAKEKANEYLEAKQRIANNAIAYARYQASKKQWSDLWQYLLDRQIIALGDVIKPKPVRSPKSSPVPKIAKSAKRRSRPKVKKPSTRKPRKLTFFARLKPSLIRLKSFVLICDWIAYTAPLCPRPKSGFPLRDRPKGDRIKSLLARTTGGYLCMKLPLKSGGFYRMNDSVKKLLTDWSGTPNRFNISAVSAELSADRRKISEHQLNLVLTDKWLDTRAIAYRLNKLIDWKMSTIDVGKLLIRRKNLGEIYQLSGEDMAIAYYSKVQATEFENDWIALNDAYLLAQSRGCTAVKNTFRKNQSFDYAEFGLEFRANVPSPENTLFRWRDIWKDRNI